MKLPTGRQVIAAILIVFAIYAVYNDPAGSAQTTGSAWDTVKQGASSVGTFFDTLIGS